MNKVVRVTDPETHDFDEIGDAGTQTITLARRLSSSEFTQLDLLVRVHEAVTLVTDGSIVVNVVADGFTHDDPSVDFFGEVLASVTLSGALTAGQFEIATATSKLGSMVAVQIVATQPQTAGTLSSRLSMDLVFKSS